MFVVDSCRGQCCDKQRDAKDSNTLVTLQRGGFFASAIFLYGWCNTCHDSEVARVR